MLIKIYLKKHEIYLKISFRIFIKHLNPPVIKHERKSLYKLVTYCVTDHQIIFIKHICLDFKAIDSRATNVFHPSYSFYRL